MAVRTESKAQIFDLRTPYLKQGRTTDVRARTEMMTVTAKVYAEGGENAMHCHPLEDHTFIVLEGEAVFHIDTDDNVQVLHRWEGVMLPRGTYYWFHASGDRNLVMVRVGASENSTVRERIGPDGRPLPGKSAENKDVPRIEMEGKYFGD